MFAQIADSGAGAWSAVLAIVAILTLNHLRPSQLNPEEGNQHYCPREERRWFLRMNAIKSSTREWNWIDLETRRLLSARFDAEIAHGD